MPIVILHGPQGTHKTQRAALALQRFQCQRVVEEWDGRSKLAQGDLAITHRPPPYVWPGWSKAQVVAADDLPLPARTAPVAELPRPIVVVYGVALFGGEQRRAALWLAHYGCHRFVDAWDGTTPLQPGDLATTALSPPFPWPGYVRAIADHRAKRVSDLPPQPALF